MMLNNVSKWFVIGTDAMTSSRRADYYLADGRPIWLIGLSFDSKTRRLVDYAAERFDGLQA